MCYDNAVDIDALSKEETMSQGAFRPTDGLGPRKTGPLTSIGDDPSRAGRLGGMDAGEALAELSRKCSAPIIARMREGRLVCVCPTRRVALLRLAAEEGLCPDECSYRLVEGMSDAGAAALGGFVDCWLEQRKSDQLWRREVIARHDDVLTFEGEPWMRGGIWRTLGAACGTHTSAFVRVKSVEERCTPKALAEVNGGRLGLWSAYELCQLPPEDQDRIIDEAGDGGSTITELVREAKEPAPSVDDVTMQVDKLEAAVRAGKAMPSPEAMVSLHSAMGRLSSAVIAEWGRE